MKWVKEGILVRMVNKNISEGGLYGKELEITTVLDEYTFEAQLHGETK